MSTKSSIVVLALDLEGTLISNAVSQFPRPGLSDFLEFCESSVGRIVFYTAVRDELCSQIVDQLVSDGEAPVWLREIPYVQWDRHFKDLNNIPDANAEECLIVDDNRDYILPDQMSQWISIEKYESPYPNDDQELLRIQTVIAERISSQ